MSPKTLTSLICLTLLASSLAVQSPDMRQASHYAMTKDNEIYEIPHDMTEVMLNDPTVVATASWLDDRNGSGWTYLYVNTSSAFPDQDQGYAVGQFEGQLAYNLIWDTFRNEAPFRNQVDEKVKGFVDDQLTWIEDQITQNPNDNYWQLVNVAMSQKKGIYDGFIKAIEQHVRPDLYLSADEVYYLTYLPDLLDVQTKFSGVAFKDPHCSFLLRLADDDLFGSQTTWMSYQIMLKTYKVYYYNLTNPLVNNRKFTFSSQPGLVSSTDDYYVLENNKFVAETSLGSNNNSVWGYVHTDSVPYWARVTVANWVFDTQENWANTYFAYRSGTYNNQWMVVDYNQYNTYKNNLSAAENIIWIIEEFYYLTSQQDVTQALLIPQGYVAGYNIPYNATIAAVADNPTSYTNDTRAILFAKYAPNVQTLSDFQAVMRMNNISDTGNYCEAIACRCDLNKTADQPFGALDCKVTSSELVANLQSQIIIGPTTYDDLPVFTWDKWPEYALTSLGQPRTFNFSWVLLDPLNNVDAQYMKISSYQE